MFFSTDSLEALKAGGHWHIEIIENLYVTSTDLEIIHFDSVIGPVHLPQGFGQWIELG